MLEVYRLLYPIALLNRKVAFDEKDDRVTQQILRFEEIRLYLSVVMDKIAMWRDIRSESSWLWVAV